MSKGFIDIGGSSLRLSNISGYHVRDIERYEIGQIPNDKIGGESILFGLATILPKEKELIQNPHMEWLFASPAEFVGDCWLG